MSILYRLVDLLSLQRSVNIVSIRVYAQCHMYTHVTTNMLMSSVYLKDCPPMVTILYMHVMDNTASVTIKNIDI